VATLNLWNLSEPYERRRELILSELARLQPDLVGFQEVMDAPQRGYNQARDLARLEGYHVRYFPAAPLGDGTIGNAVLSRYPITDGAYEPLPATDGTMARIVIRADVQLPEGRLHFFCTHLSHRTDESFRREAQVEGVDRFVRQGTRELPRILVGDFNADPDSTEIRFLTGKATLGGRSTYYQDAAAIRRAEAPTWAERNPYTDVFREGDRRIDYIFVTHPRPDGNGAVASCRLAFDAPGPDGVFPSDHFGVFAEVRIGRPAGSGTGS
jgi:endonuclease/exonuclease/phosphatase family metal-dependent hydrolase